MQFKFKCKCGSRVTVETDTEKSSVEMCSVCKNKKAQIREKSEPFKKSKSHTNN